VAIQNFNIIGTLLVRACGDETTVYDILALRVLGEESTTCERADFACRRVMANRSARDKYRRPISLEEIYDVADFTAQTSMSNIDIMQLELQIEFEMLVGVCRMRQVVASTRQKVRKQGGILQFVSDSYLPVEFLADILKREGFLDDTDQVCTSNGDGPTLIHGYTYIHNHNFTAYQKKMASMPDYCQLQSPKLLASISRAVLMKNGCTSENLFTTDVIAPNVVSVVYELMERAHKRDVRKLFFLARDAKLMYEIASVFKPLFPEMELTYMYVSRTSLYFPSVPEVNVEWLNYIYSAMKYMGFSVNDFIKKYMPGLDVYKTFSTFEEVCVDSETLLKLKEYHTNQRQLMKEYFERIGLAQTTEKVGLVDYNASGKTVACINRILSQLSCNPALGFSYCAIDERLTCPDLTILETITYSERFYGLNNRILATIYIFEDYCLLTDHGRTSHYGRDASGKVVPILEDESPETKRYNARLFAIHAKLCKEWADLYMKSGAYKTSAYNITCAQWILMKFARNPRREYLKCLAGNHYDIGGMKINNIIKWLSFTELVRVMTIEDKENGSWGWLRGSVVFTFGNLGRFIIYTLGVIKSWKRKLAY
jgi:hypothetical protein